jgi:hypothetical protein
MAVSTFISSSPVLAVQSPRANGEICVEFQYVVALDLIANEDVLQNRPFLFDNDLFIGV